MPKTARIGIDYLPAVCHAPGVGRYVREMVRAMVRLPGAPPLHLFEVGGGARTMEGPALGLEGAAVKRVRSRVPRRAVVLGERLLGLGADRLLGGVDLFHRALPGYPPVSRALEVLAISELASPGSRAEEELASAARRARGLVVFCEHYRELLPERLGVDPARVWRVPVGCDHWLRDLPAAGDPGFERAATPRLVVLGALRKARHPLLILQAFELLRADGVRAELIYCGRTSDAAPEFAAARAASPVAGDVRWFAEPREERMPALVASASVLVHLADEEGTAVTPLEAFSMGTGVVANALPAFVEDLGDAAALLDAPPAAITARALADALAAELERAPDPAAAARRRALAAERTWQANAAATRLVWDEILGASGR